MRAKTLDDGGNLLGTAMPPAFPFINGVPSDVVRRPGIAREQVDAHLPKRAARKVDLSCDLTTDQQPLLMTRG